MADTFKEGLTTLGLSEGQGEKILLDETINAQEKLLKNRFIGFDGKHCVNGAIAKGVTQYDIPLGATDTIISLARIRVEAAEPINEGDEISSDATGKAKKATATDKVLGVAYSSCTAAGELIVIKLR